MPLLFSFSLRSPASPPFSFDLVLYLLVFVLLLIDIQDVEVVYHIVLATDNATVQGIIKHNIIKINKTTK